jgi:hypothetical protein
MFINNFRQFFSVHEITILRTTNDRPTDRPTDAIDTSYFVTLRPGLQSKLACTTTNTPKIRAEAKKKNKQQRKEEQNDPRKAPIERKRKPKETNLLRRPLRRIALIEHAFIDLLLAKSIPSFLLHRVLAFLFPERKHLILSLLFGERSRSDGEVIKIRTGWKTYVITVKGHKTKSREERQKSVPCVWTPRHRLIS